MAKDAAQETHTPQGNTGKAHTPSFPDPKDRKLSLQEWARQAGLSRVALAALAARYSPLDRHSAAVWMANWTKLQREVA